MSEGNRPQRKTFGRRILTDNTAIFRLKDIESRLAEEVDGPTNRIPVEPPALPPSVFDEPTGSVEINLDAPGPGLGGSTARVLDNSMVSDGGHLLAFFSVKGGVGSTALSLNVGGALAAAGFRVCIVDMDLQMGSAAYSLNMETSRSIASFAKAIRDGDAAVADFPIAQHDSGVYVLDQPDLAEIETLGSNGLPDVLRSLKKSFDYVVVDGLRDFGDHALLSLDEADRILMVVNSDVPALRCGIRALELFRRLGYDANRIGVVMNQYGGQDADFIDAVQSAYGRPVNWMIPEIKILPECMNTGQLVSQASPDSRDAELLDNFARTLAGLPVAEPVKRGFFAKLFSKGS